MYLQKKIVIVIQILHHVNIQQKITRHLTYHDVHDQIPTNHY